MTNPHIVQMDTRRIVQRDSDGVITAIKKDRMEEIKAICDALTAAAKPHGHTQVTAQIKFYRRVPSTEPLTCDVLQITVWP